MMKNFLINLMIFVLVASGGLMMGWHIIQEDVILFFTYVPIDATLFERNLAQAQQEASFDWDAVEMLEAFDWMDHIGSSELVSPVGELIMPSIDVSLPIFLGVGEPNISLGAGTVRPDIAMGVGNYSLASHWNPNAGVLFGGLDQIQVGDPLILRDGNFLYIYETIIGDNYIVEAYRVDILDDVAGKVYLTLFTCTPDGTQRVMVRGEFVTKISMTELDEVANLLGGLDSLQAERNLGFDLSLMVDAIENSEVPFPIIEVAVVIGGSLLLAIIVVKIANKGSKKKKRKARR